MSFLHIMIFYKSIVLWVIGSSKTDFVHEGKNTKSEKLVSKLMGEEQNWKEYL